MADRSNKSGDTSIDLNRSEQNQGSTGADTSSNSNDPEADQEPEKESTDEAVHRSPSVESLNTMTDTTLLAVGSSLAFQGQEGVVSRGLSVLDRLAEEQASRRAAEAALQRRVVALTMRMIEQAREEQTAPAESVEENDDEDDNE